MNKPFSAAMITLGIIMLIVILSATSAPHVLVSLMGIFWTSTTVIGAFIFFLP